MGRVGQRAVALAGRAQVLLLAAARGDVAAGENTSPSAGEWVALNATRW
jgi:hypothetical protein